MMTQRQIALYGRLLASPRAWGGMGRDMPALRAAWLRVMGLSPQNTLTWWTWRP